MFYSSFIKKNVPIQNRPSALQPSVKSVYPTFGETFSVKCKGAYTTGI